LIAAGPAAAVTRTAAARALAESVEPPGAKITGIPFSVRAGGEFIGFSAYGHFDRPQEIAEHIPFKGNIRTFFQVLDKSDIPANPGDIINVISASDRELPVV
jgi:hypothetical protein